MAATQRRAGLRALTIDDTRFDVVGNITYSLGRPVFEEVVGADRIHGVKETPGVPMVELEIRDRGDLDVADLVTKQGVTVTIELASGKTVVLRNAVQTGSGEQGSEEGVIAVRFVGESAEEIPAA